MKSSRKPRQMALEISRNTFPIADAVMVNHLFPFMDNKSMSGFTRLSIYSHHVAQAPLLQREVETLFMYIIEGKMKHVKKNIKATPKLALATWKSPRGRPATIKNKVGQLIAVEGKTAYEFALGEEDHEIAQLLKKAILKISNEQKANDLFLKQRPAGWEAAEKEKFNPVMDALVRLLQAMRLMSAGDIELSTDHRRPDELILKDGTLIAEAYFEFKLALDAVFAQPTITGRHYNIGFLKALFQMYENDFERDSHSPISMFFWQRIIGYYQRFLPANYAQVFCKGIFETLSDFSLNLSQSRSFDILVFPDNTWIPTHFTSLASGALGIDFAINPADYVEQPSARPWSRPWIAHALHVLCQQKSKFLDSLIDSQPSKSCCVIM